jgi:hypothetical protein
MCEQCERDKAELLRQIERLREQIEREARKDDTAEAHKA